MLFSRSEGCEVESLRDTLFKGFGNLYSTYLGTEQRKFKHNCLHKVCHSKINMSLKRYISSADGFQSVVGIVNLKSSSLKMLSSFFLSFNGADL